MSENKNSIIASASHYALILGGFWVFKYLFVIGSEYSEFSKYIVNILSIGTMFLLYILLCRYRDKDLGGKISYGQGILFTMLLFFFASLIEAVIISLHLFVISPEMVVSLNEQIYKVLETLNPSAESMQAIEYIFSFGALYYVINYILTDIFIGFLLSLIFGFIVSRPQKHTLNK